MYVYCMYALLFDHAVEIKRRKIPGTTYQPPGGMTCSIVPVVDSCCRRCMDWSTSHAPLPPENIFTSAHPSCTPPPPPKKILLYILRSFAETITFVSTHRHRLHLSRPLHQALHVGQHARQPRRLLARDGLERVGHRLVLADQLGRLFQPRVQNKREKKKVRDGASLP